MDPKLMEANEKLTEAIRDALTSSTVGLCESLKPEEIRTRLEVILTPGQFQTVFNERHTPTSSNQVQTILGYLKTSENGKYFAFRDALLAKGVERKNLVDMYLPNLQEFVDAVKAAKPRGSSHAESPGSSAADARQRDLGSGTSFASGARNASLTSDMEYDLR